MGPTERARARNKNMGASSSPKSQPRPEPAERASEPSVHARGGASTRPPAQSQSPDKLPSRQRASSAARAADAAVAFVKASELVNHLIATATNWQAAPDARVAAVTEFMSLIRRFAKDSPAEASRLVDATRPQRALLAALGDTDAPLVDAYLQGVSNIGEATRTATPIVPALLTIG